ncbi:tRNA threonylcarbamoyladenosine dehydratase [Coralloluteibacterium stylophorae]|uniref:tRNA threonylcarbamoyladenosine dehydratase n=1 Tax=Coralloluteibacterium stylophorae TaxID=1776034 RepID=A0A8J7VY34_9GAMM|nr:tRNA threonylcarbamoyladenosine dehydratase [Coralloluteibacterium stylophorae]MBS7455835.1 tRNA threonylcarbamoyladenosine dehydratase [Coralloluteibacterium stylophorae]
MDSASSTAFDRPVRTDPEQARLERFGAIERLYGRGSLARFGAASVCVVGLGGVGSWAVEALARSGIGRLGLLDADDVCVSNTNRQLHALDGGYGRSKASVLAERCRAISPGIDLAVVEQFLTVPNMDVLLDAGYDIVIDACDSLRVKVETVAWARRRKLPLVVVGSAGGRTDPTQVRVRDLSRTEHDAMLALVRKRLRHAHGFPRNPDRFFGVSAVYSLENVQYPQADGSVCGVRPSGGADGALRMECGGGLGSATHVTGAFAFAAVSRTLALLLRQASATKAGETA